MPARYHEEGLDTQVLAALGIEPGPEPDLGAWHRIVASYQRPEGEVAVAVVGKYTGLMDAYKSLNEALVHGGIANNVRVSMRWIDADEFLRGDASAGIQDVNAVLVPGGFGERGVEGKIAAVTYARTRKLPFLGICFGMQLACIEAARNLAGINGASSTEFGPCADPIVGLLTEWEHEGTIHRRGCQRQAGRHDAAGRLSRARSSPRAWPPGSTARAGSTSGTGTATRSTSTTRQRWRRRACASPACRPTAGCRRSWRTRTIPGSWACSSTRS